MARNIQRDRKAVSPVISTIIIVAIAIAIAIAVAYWMVGIAGIFTKMEKAEVTAAWADANGTTSYNVTMTLKNTGSTIITPDNIFINKKPYTTYASVSVSAVSANWTDPINQGDTRTIIITTPYNTTPFKPGSALDISVHTVTGQEYPKSVVLP